MEIHAQQITSTLDRIKNNVFIVFFCMPVILCLPFCFVTNIESYSFFYSLNCLHAIFICLSMIVFLSQINIYLNYRLGFFYSIDLGLGVDYIKECRYYYKNIQVNILVKLQSEKRLLKSIQK